MSIELNVPAHTTVVHYHCLACDYKGVWGDDCDCALPKATKRLHEAALEYELRPRHYAQLERAAIEYAKAVRKEPKR